MSGSGTDSLRAELIAIFRAEATEHLEAIATEMAALAATTDSAAARPCLERLFRTVHTLKGAARSLSVSGVEQTCHEIEELCSALGGGQLDLDEASRTELADLVDDLAGTTQRALEAAGAGTAALPAAPPAFSPPAPSPAGPDTGTRLSRAPGDGFPAPADTGARPVRAPQPPPAVSPRGPSGTVPPAAMTPPPPAFLRLEAGQIQRLGLMAEDLLAPRLASQARTAEARQLHARLAALRRAGRAVPRPEAPVDPAVARIHAEELRGAEEAARALAVALAEDNRILRGLVDTLVAALRRARMIPAGDMLAVFPAMVADLARELGKVAVLRITGHDLLIDRQVADLIKDPLIHMIRNALDHGIETPARRAAAGKPAEGTITIAIGPAEGGRISFEIRDDGAGIDLTAVRAAAIRNRLLSEAEARDLCDTDAVDLVFQSHLSTRSVISLTSGRGLGLAIARERVERLGGVIQATSTPGTQTVLHMAVPGALANFRGIGVRVGATDYVWPREAVERTIALPSAEAAAARARGLIRVDGDLLPFGDLARVLGRADGAPATPPAGVTGALVVRAGPRRGVVAVADVTGDCEAIVKELRPPLLRVRHVLAAGLLGSGRLALILRPADILDALTQRPGTVDPPAPASLPRGRQRLLIVDDSVTTRAMEVGLLESAGYDVTAAADGQEAWEILRHQTFDAVISDVDMPNLDGFALTERIRADARLRQTPIVLVTAMERREDHDRGLRLGANAYVMKSAFDQSLLIDLVRRVL